jgi:hypothetical protein
LRRQNEYAEHAIGSIRRECLDHLVARNQTRLQRLLKGYGSYYDAAATRLKEVHRTASS